MYLILFSNRSLGIPRQVYIVGTVTSVCDGMGLTKGQTRLCVVNRELMPSIRNGATLAIQQCEYQFKYRRWNCSVPERDSKAPFRRITGKGKYLAIPIKLWSLFLN